MVTLLSRFMSKHTSHISCVCDYLFSVFLTIKPFVFGLHLDSLDYSHHLAQS